MSSMNDMQKKRVLFLNYEYPPLGGGAANATKYLLDAYSKENIAVDLVTSAPDAQKQVVDVGNSVKVYLVPIGKRPGTLHHQSPFDLLRYSWSGFWQARSLMKKNQYDVIHAFFGVPCGFMALVLGRMFNVPYLVSLRGSDVPGYSHRFKLIYPFLKILIRLVWRKAALVVANSKGLQELALETNKKQPISIIPNGVDTIRFSPNVTRKGEKEAGTIIITVGATRITPRKGIRFLLEAVYNLRDQYPQVRVEIMGEGSERESLEAWVKEKDMEERIVFVGRIPADHTPGWYRRADIFVLPSANEGMSNALLEALATGLPAIVTDTGGSHELVTNQVNGLYIEKESAASIQEALVKLLDDADMRARFGEASRIKAETLAWENVASEYMACYEKMTI